MQKEVQNRVCKVCKCGNTSNGNWVLGYFIPDNIRSLDDDINIAVKIGYVGNAIYQLQTQKQTTKNQRYHNYHSRRKTGTVWCMYDW